MKVNTPLSTADLPRSLHFYDLTLLIIGSTIGSGIFFVPSIIARQLHGSGILVLAAWIAGGALSFCGALTLAELTTMKPEAGGLYVFIRDCFGPLLAFLYGWTLFFVICSGTAATLAAAFSDNFARIYPTSLLERKLVGIGFIGVLTAINVLGTRHSANLQDVVTLIKIGSLLVISIGIFAGLHHPLGMGHVSVMPLGALASSFGLALVNILWAYEGWQYATYNAGEAVNPTRDFPRAFLVGTLTVIAVYVLINIAYARALGFDAVAQSTNVAADAVSSIFGRRSALLVVIAIAISVFGGANGLILSNPRVFYAMAKEGLLFSKLGQVHPRFQTPAFAIIVSSSWAVLLLVTGTFESLLIYVVFTGWLFYALAATCVFVYRRNRPEMARPFRVPGYPWVPGIFVAAALALAMNTLARRPMSSFGGLAVVAGGILAYVLRRRMLVKRTVSAVAS